MARSNPGFGPLKPHLYKSRSGIWVRAFRDQTGTVFGIAQVSWMTAHSKQATEAAIWCANHNARIFARGRRG